MQDIVDKNETLNQEKYTVLFSQMDRKNTQY